MVMKISFLCDECGEPATFRLAGATFSIVIDGVNEYLQDADFCDDHKPRDGERQPHNCKRVTFRYSEDSIAHAD